MVSGPDGSEILLDIASGNPLELFQPARARAVAKVTVQSHDSKPYDQSAGPVLMEINISETFTGDLGGEATVRALQVLRNDQSAASSACNDSAEDWADARAPSCFKVQKLSKMARSRRIGLSFPDRRQVIFPGCAARALPATLEESPSRRWITGSNDVATVRSPLRRKGSTELQENPALLEGFTGDVTSVALTLLRPEGPFLAGRALPDIPPLRAPHFWKE